MSPRSGAHDHLGMSRFRSQGRNPPLAMNCRPSGRKKGGYFWPVAKFRAAVDEAELAARKVRWVDVGPMTNTKIARTKPTPMPACVRCIEVLWARITQTAGH